jgi:hypothetical protein
VEPVPNNQIDGKVSRKSSNQKLNGKGEQRWVMNDKKLKEYIEKIGEKEAEKISSTFDLGKTFNSVDKYHPLSNALCKKFGLSVSAVFGLI